jgi:hypothetical protein
MGRVTRYPAKPKLTFVHEVSVSHTERDEPWCHELLERVAGRDGYKKRTPFWANTMCSFARKEQADQLRLYLERHREVARKLEAKKRPVQGAPSRSKPPWRSTPTGLIREVVQSYRRARLCAHGPTTTTRPRRSSSVART